MKTTHIVVPNEGTTFSIKKLDENGNSLGLIAELAFDTESEAQAFADNLESGEVKEAAASATVTSDEDIEKKSDVSEVSENSSENTSEAATEANSPEDPVVDAPAE